MKFKTFSNGKILFTSEYFVLKGSLSLAIPTKYGQSFSFSENDSGFINWKSFSSNGKLWFQCKLKKDNLKCITTSNHDLSNTLTSILKSARQLNQSFFSNILGGNVITRLDFPLSWGLGSSSTLINNISKWAKVDPFELLWSVFEGSGFDIACAESKSPILYKLNNKNFSILHNLGVINKTKGNLETAKDYFVEALEIQENLELLSEIANIYKELNNYEIAEKYCQMVFKKDKSHQKTNLILSEIYFKNNEIHKALL